MILFLILSFSFSDFIDDIGDLWDGINKVSGPTGFEVLQFDMDAMSGAMAGNYWDGGTHALLFNPAEIISFEGSSNWNSSFKFTHRTLACGMNTDFIGYSMPLLRGRIGISFLGFFSGDMELRSYIPGEPVGSYSAENLIAGLTYSKRFSELTMGVTGRFLHERIFTDNYSTYSFDLGVSRFLPVKEDFLFIMDFALLHLGPKYLDGYARLPTTWHLGIKTRICSFKGGISVKKPLNTYIQYSMGVEYSIKWLKLRGGKKFKNPLESFSVGFGFTKDRFSIDYSYSPNENRYGDSHLFTASVGL
jgi:hypothetical protein